MHALFVLCLHVVIGYWRDQWEEAWVCFDIMVYQKQKQLITGIKKVTIRIDEKSEGRKEERKKFTLDCKSVLQ